jgi:hypothetical protein
MASVVVSGGLGLPLVCHQPPASLETLIILSAWTVEDGLEGEWYL